MLWIRSRTVLWLAVLLLGAIVRLLADRHLPTQMTKLGTNSWPAQGKIATCGRSRKRDELYGR